MHIMPFLNKICLNLLDVIYVIVLSELLRKNIYVLKCKLDRKLKEFLRKVMYFLCYKPLFCINVKSGCHLQTLLLYPANYKRKTVNNSRKGFSLIK